MNQPTITGSLIRKIESIKEYKQTKDNNKKLIFIVDKIKTITTAKMKVLIFLLFLTLITISTAYLTPSQKIQIQRIIQNTETPEPIKTRVKQIIFKHYLPWVKYVSNQFCKNNPQLLSYVYYNSINKNIKRNIYKNDELYYDACVGFSKALKKFNGNCSTITNYATPYIKHEIYKGITQSTKQSRYREYIEKALKNLKTKQQKMHYYYYEITEVKKETTHSNIHEIQEIIKTLPPNQQQIMSLRYDVTTMKKIRTINQVCKLMGFSNETYRKQYNKIKTQIKYRIEEQIKRHTPHF